MVMLAGAIKFDERLSSGALAESVARATASNRGLRERLLYTDERLTLFVIERPADSPAIESSPVGDGRQRWILGDVNYLRTPLPQASSQAALLGDLPTAKIPGRWIAIEVQPSEEAVQIATDRLGLAWLYVAQVPNGFVFSSDFAAVAGAVGSGLSIDGDTALLELALGYAPDDRTVFNEINLLPPGSVIELNPSGMRIVTSAAIRYGDRFAGLSRARKYDRLDEIYDAIMRNVGETAEAELVVSISAGYDSRYSLAFLERHGIKARLCTFGALQSEEVQGAVSVCNKIGRPTNVFSLSEADWVQWYGSIQRLGNTGMIQWSGWAESWFEFVREHGRFAVIGYLGDALSGKHLGNAQRNEGDWLRFWEHWSTEGGWANSLLLTPQARKRLRECLTARLDQAAGRASIALPHQRALHLDLYGRQRRWVASQPNLMSHFLTPVLFFYDDDLIDFWSNLPVEDLLQQNLYLSYARSRFSRLFPRAEGRPASLAERTMRKGAKLLKAVLAGKSGGARPVVIDHRPIIIGNKQHILDLIDRVAPLAAPIFDVESFREQVADFSQSQTIPSSQIMRAVNLLMLFDLSK